MQSAHHDREAVSPRANEGRHRAIVPTRHYGAITTGLRLRRRVVEWRASATLEVAAVHQRLEVAEVLLEQQPIDVDEQGSERSPGGRVAREWRSNRAGCRPPPG